MKHKEEAIMVVYKTISFVHTLPLLLPHFPMLFSELPIIEPILRAIADE